MKISRPLFPFYEDAYTTLYHGDAARVIPRLKRRFSLVLIDPPYGLNKTWKRQWFGNNGVARLSGSIPEWDARPLSNELLQLVLSIGEHTILWGGNFYPLPPSRCWYVWDKLQPNRGAECELAWTNLDKAPRVFRMSRIDAYCNKAIFKKVHPAEKPIQLMEFCIENLHLDSLIDPCAGVGTSLIAAKKSRIKSVGIEARLDYCQESVRRLKTIEVS